MSSFENVLQQSGKEDEMKIPISVQTDMTI